MRSAARTTRLLTCAGALVAALGLSACQVKDDGDNLVAGKAAFVQKCGACHALTRAGTTGVTGPNLDASFERAIEDGMGRSTVEGIVRAQIENPNIDAQLDPQKKVKEPSAYMPANLATGEEAEDIAAYVAYATARSGEDTGQLADVGVKKATEAAEAENGTLKIDADPGGALAYIFASATAPAGALTITSPNESSVPHNIAIEGNGLDQKGPVVQNGGVSEIKIDLDPGEYTFYCSVPGHREGGMAGKLTVE
jgi:plastocyanin